MTIIKLLYRHKIGLSAFLNKSKNNLGRHDVWL